MPLIIPGSEVPIPNREDGLRYTHDNAERIAADLAALRATYLDWEVSGAVPQSDGIVLGRGTFSTVEKAGDYARREPALAFHVERYANSLVLGLGASGLEQIRAVSDKHTYSDIMPGKLYSEATTEDIVVLEDPDIANATLDTLTVMQARGIGMDIWNTNAHVNPMGIGIFDYRKDPNQSLEAKVYHIADQIIARGGLSQDKYDHTAYCNEVRLRIPTLIRLNELVNKRAQIAPDFWGPSTNATLTALRMAQLTLR